MPAKAGLFAVTLKVVDQGTGSDDFTTLPLRVSYERGLAIVTTALPDAFVGQSYLAGLSHNGLKIDPKIEVKFENPCVKQVDTGLTTWGCAPVDPLQTLPPGLTLNEKGELRGTPLSPPNLGTEGDPKSPQSVTYSFLVKAVRHGGAAGRAQPLHQGPAGLLQGEDGLQRHGPPSVAPRAARARRPVTGAAGEARLNTPP